MTPGSGSEAGRSDPGRRELGQSTAELALLLPMLVVAALAVVQVGVVARDYVLVNHAVREAARQAAVDPTERSALEAASRAAPGLDPAELDVVLTGGRSAGDVLTVELRYRAATAVPMVGLMLGDISMGGVASVRVE